MKLKIRDSVKFIGSVPHVEVPDWLNSFDIYAALSVLESFGVSVIEASACRLPVVVWDGGISGGGPRWRNRFYRAKAECKRRGRENIIAGIRYGPSQANGKKGKGIYLRQFRVD